MRPSRALAIATVGFVLAPFATITLSFRQALVAQAAMALALALALMLYGRATPGWRQRLLDAPRGYSLAVLLWTAATVLGTLVGLLHGNGLSRIAGQALSLGMLPLAYGGARLLPWLDHEDTRRRAFVRALVGATAAAAGIQLLVWVAGAIAGGRAAIRLFLNNSVGVSSLLPLVLVLAVALFRGESDRPSSFRTILSQGILTVLLITLVGSAVRGAWVATALAFALFWLLTGTRPRKSTLALAGAGTVLGILVWIWAGHFLDRPRPNLLQSPERISARFQEDLQLLDDGGLRWTSHLRRAWVGSYFPADAVALYRLRCRAVSPTADPAFVSVSWRNDAGDHLGGMTARLATAGEPYLAEAFGSPPKGTTRGIVLVGAGRSEGRSGPWEIRDLEVHHMGSARALALVQQVAYLRNRVGSLLGRQSTNPHQHQGSVRFRLMESQTLLVSVGESSWDRILWGHGLGATFTLQGVETHYIHNFYLFALFKLGVVGSLLLLTGGGLWTALSVRDALAARRERKQAAHGDGRSHPGRSFPFEGAAAAGWIVYWIWSVSSPEILNFRLAPLWGLLLAVQAGTGVGSGKAVPNSVAHR